jgi:hypothetical protein
MELDPDTTEPVPPGEDGEETPEPAAAPKRSKGGAQGGVLAAAMLALGEILEPEKTIIEIEQESDDPIDDPPFTLDFGDLPPLN